LLTRRDAQSLTLEWSYSDFRTLRRAHAGGLTDVIVSTDSRTGFYIRRVCAAMAASLARDFRCPVADEARRILEAPAGFPGYVRELRDFRVSAIRVTGDALVLSLDFELVVK
jgi:hypothetical protein